MTTETRMTRACGFTLVELLIVVAIIAVLAAIAVPLYEGYVRRARITKAIAEIRMISNAIDTYFHQNVQWPTSLAEVDHAGRRDPWGRPYAYLSFATLKGKGAMRKDKNLVPLNTHYDLYSKGPDGQSKPPLNAKVSRDDVLRANDGAFIGLASKY